MNIRRISAPVVSAIDSVGVSSMLPATAILPNVILVQPEDIPYVDYASHMLKEQYSVTIAKDDRELFLLRGGGPFTFALLSDYLDSVALVAAAQSVRRQWPKARIVILGQAAERLEDNLYDETVDHSASPDEMLAVLARRSCDPWSSRVKGRPFLVQSTKADESTNVDGMPGVKAI
ncbi:MAG: hypothetical protein ABI142_05735 [Bryocella sp.]